jgi:hypothetical protein
MSEIQRARCVHCGSDLCRIELPEMLFDHEFDLACFNDDCPYYVRGWAWMEEKFGARTSYRYRIDPRSGRASPLAVWSPTALRSNILPDDLPAAGGEGRRP